MLICIVAVACRVQLEGNLVRWERWNLRVSFNYREGLVRQQLEQQQQQLQPPTLVSITRPSFLSL